MVPKLHLIGGCLVQDYMYQCRNSQLLLFNYVKHYGLLQDRGINRNCIRSLCR